MGMTDEAAAYDRSSAVWLVECFEWAERRLASLPQENLGAIARSLVGVRPGGSVPSSSATQAVPETSTRAVRRRRPASGQQGSSNLSGQ